MKYLGIDLGSSYVKAVLMDLDQHAMISSEKSPSPGRRPNPNQNYYEIPASELVNIVKNLIDGYTKRYRDIEGLIISTQMHGFVYSTPGSEDLYVSWQDMRCMNQKPGTSKTWLQDMGEQITPEDMEEFGVYLKPSLGVCNLYVLLKEQPEMPRNGSFFTLGSYLIYALTGNNICHITNAAPTGLVDVKHCCWSRKMLKWMRLEEMQLPKLANSDYEICGTYLSNGCVLKVHPDYGDMQVAALGSEISVGDVLVNVATGAQVIRCGEAFSPGSYEIRPYFGGNYLYTISNMPAGRNLDVLVNFIRESVSLITGQTVDSQRVWDCVHTSPVGCDRELIVETSFYKNPYFPDGGAIRGITHSNLHMNTLFGAAFRNMAETYWYFIQKLGEETDQIQRIVCSGGVNWKTPQIREILGKISRKRCILSPIADEALAGMYHLAMVCSGICESIEESRKTDFSMLKKSQRKSDREEETSVEGVQRC